MAIRIAGSTVISVRTKRIVHGVASEGRSLRIQIGQQGRGRRSRRSHAKKPDAHHEILDRA